MPGPLVASTPPSSSAKSAAGSIASGKVGPPPPLCSFRNARKNFACRSKLAFTRRFRPLPPGVSSTRKSAAITCTVEVLTCTTRKLSNGWSVRKSPRPVNAIAASIALVATITASQRGISVCRCKYPRKVSPSTLPVM